MLETDKNPVEKVRQLHGKRVRSNKGAAGVDETTLRSIEEHGVTQFLEGIQVDLKAGRYRPSPVKRRWIPKTDGKLHDSEDAEHTTEPARALYAAVAVAQGDEASPGTRA